MKANLNRGGATPAAFPFPAVVGMERAREALLLLAVDPGLKGVLISAEAGTAKSVLARSLAALLQGLPGLPETPFVEVPPGVTEDCLLGSLDWERTLLSGKRQSTNGLLARAHRRFVCADHVNLIERAAGQILADALNTGVIRLEREGLSAVVPAEFALIGTYDPEESAPPPALADAVGLHAVEARHLSDEERTELLRRAGAFDRDAPGFAASFAVGTAALQRRIARARSRLSAVQNTLADIEWLSEAALQLGVEGHRADIFALRAARAQAVLLGHTRVEEQDLDAAVRLVLLPRATALPFAGWGEQTPREEAENSPGDSESRAAETAPRGERSPDGAMNELVIEPQEWDPEEFRLPEKILSLASRNAAKKGAQRSRRREKNAPEKTSRERGRFVPAVAAGAKAGRIAVAATLRAAAPFQRERRGAAKAAPGSPAIRVSASDLRYKQFKQKSGMLVIFVVDSSGSMAANRIHLAKGAVLRLLERSYLNRDKVAVITFRGKGAELLLPPTQSVELAKRVLDHLPVGGGTPLASGLEAALSLARRNRPGDGAQKLLVMVTDGTANVTRASATSNRATIDRELVWRELEEVCALWRREGLESVVIDTRDRHVTGGEARKLAGMLGGRHVHLAHADSGATYDTLAASLGGRNRARRADRAG